MQKGPAKRQPLPDHVAHRTRGRSGSVGIYPPLPTGAPESADRQSRATTSSRPPPSLRLSSMVRSLPQPQAPTVSDLRALLEPGFAGTYTIERELGRGGMATVFLARDLKHHRPVALKALHPHLSHVLGPERFQREIEFLAGLTHPHIVPLHDSGGTAGLLWYTMPYVDGESLRDRLS